MSIVSTKSAHRRRNTSDGSVQSKRSAKQSTWRASGEGPDLFQDESSSLRPLQALFHSYSKIRTDEKASIVTTTSKKSTNDEDQEIKEGRITLHGLETWFKQANVFSDSVCKMTATDLRTIFARAEKPGISFEEFEELIESLCQFRKVHPSTIILRLQLAGSPDLQSRFFHATGPEGTVDRVVDAFVLQAEYYGEKFIDLSTDPYEEPICFGGIGKAGHQNRDAESKREEEMELRAKALSMMTKGVDAAKEDKLIKNFIYFAKNGSYFNDGRTMELTQLIKWMKQAGVIDGTTITSMDIGYLFKRLYSLNWRIYVDDLNQFLHELSLWKNTNPVELFQMLRSCGPPSSSSVSVISMQLPVSMLEILKKTLTDFSDDFESKRDQFEPILADTPYGHTPNSRNRHFRNAIDEDTSKAKSNFVEDLQKKSTGANMLSDTANKKDSLANDETKEVFSEEKRSGKDYLVKRWNDAYPIGGMETSHRGRLVADLEQLMFGTDRADSSSSEDEEKAKIKILQTKFVMTTGNTGPMAHLPHPPVPLDEQFEKFKRFGEFQSEEGITIQNIELWFSLAGLVVQHGTTTFTNKDIEHHFNSFMAAKQSGMLDYDNFVKFVEVIGDSKGKHINSKEVKDRLARCGPPRQVRHSSVHEHDKHGSTVSSKGHKAVTPSHTAFDELEDSAASPSFKSRFLEYARFGEATVHSVGPSFAISMLNSSKWFKQAKLNEQGLNLGDVDVLYKQLFPTKQRLTIKEFLKLVEAMGKSNKKHQMSQEDIMAKLEKAGSPIIHEIKAGHLTRAASNISTVSTHK